MDTDVIIAGAGIAGLALALTLQQIGVHCTVVETVPEMKPLGVGINLQPNAVRELGDLGIGPDRLAGIGLAAREWALVGRNGRDIYAEPRGLDAGYRWPQFALHRGQLQMLLLREAQKRLPSGSIRTGCRVIGYRKLEAGGVVADIQQSDGSRSELAGHVLVGADGIHSAIRAQMHPDQPPIHWGGAFMWRGTSLGRPIRTGASFVGLGTHRHRLVFYPISAPDPATGLAVINWIAEVTVDNAGGWQNADWNRRVRHEEFVHHFDGWNYDWLDVPAMLRGAESVYEYPMIDRDPVPNWNDGPVVLIGDAAHAMYPTGSNGASQAIVDARQLGASILRHAVGAAALSDFDRRFREEISALVLRNRGAGPFGLLNLVDERCGDDFEDIDAVVPRAERDAFMARYKAAAGFAKDRLNASAPTIPPGARIG